MSRPCVTHHHACDCREAEFAAQITKAENERDRLRAVLELIDNRNRARGYPTGGEWEEIISWVQVALAQSEETK